MLLNNGDKVQYNDSYYGVGKGVVCGYRKINEIDFYAIYPQTIMKKDDYLAYIIPLANLIETPF